MAKLTGKTIETIRERRPYAKIALVVYTPFLPQKLLHQIYDELMMGILSYRDVMKSIEYATDATKMSFGRLGYMPASVVVHDGMKFPDQIAVRMKPDLRPIIKSPNKDKLHRAMSSDPRLSEEFSERVVPYRVSMARFEEGDRFAAVSRLESVIEEPTFEIFLKPSTSEEVLDGWLSLLEELGFKYKMHT